MPFEFATAARIVFGPGKLRELPNLVRPFGKRALIVTGRDPHRAAPLLDLLSSASVPFSTVSTPSEPAVATVRDATGEARQCDFVIGFGGGSAIDAAKAIAAVAANSGEPLDYLEVVGRNLPLENTPMPFIAVPTTAGTGAEVTRNAVLDSEEHGVKASLRSPSMLARIALVDPELTLDVPPPVTAATGMDTLTQLIESYVSCKTNVFTDQFCLTGLGKAPAALLAAYRDGRDRQAREAMSLSSLLSGLALANSGLGVVHGFAAPLGGLLHAPHGALCAAVLPHGMEANIAALRARASDSPALERYRTVACLLTGEGNSAPEDAVVWVKELCRKLEISPLQEHGLSRERIAEVAEKARDASSMKGNPVSLTLAELQAVLEHSF